MANKVSAFVVVMDKDMNAEDAAKFSEALGMLRGVVSVEEVQPDFLLESALLARVRAKMYEAVFEVFNVKNFQKKS